MFLTVALVRYSYDLYLYLLKSMDVADKPKI